MWLSAGGAGVCLSAGGRGGGEPPRMMGILTCWTPDSPSLSSSLPPPGPVGAGPPLCRALPGAECCVRGRRADLSPCPPLGSGARAPPRCASGYLALAGDPVLSRSRRLLLPLSGQGHVGGCGLQQSGPALGSGGFSVPRAVFSDVCLLRFRLCPGVVLQQ